MSNPTTIIRCANDPVTRRLSCDEPVPYHPDPLQSSAFALTTDTGTSGIILFISSLFGLVTLFAYQVIEKQRAYLLEVIERADRSLRDG